MKNLKYRRRVFQFLLLPVFYCLLLTASYGASTYLSITNFTSGELSPLMEGRTDMAKYTSGALTAENVFIYPQGPATKRPGLKFLAETKDSTTRSRLIPFQFSTEQTYILEFGESDVTGYARVYTDQGLIVMDWAGAAEHVVNGGMETGSPPDNWTAAYSAALTALPGGGVSGTTAIRITENGPTAWGMYQGIAVTAESDYTLKYYSKSSDTLPFQVSVEDAYDLSNDIYNSGSSVFGATWGQTVETFTVPSGVTTIRLSFWLITVQGSGKTGDFDEVQLRRTEEPVEFATPYLSEDLQDLKYCQSADIMYLTHPDYDVYELARSGHTIWALSEISGASAFTSDPFTGVTGYPSSCTFHENRLVFAGTPTYPNTLWMSKSGNFTDFTTGALDDDAIQISLASDQVNAIQWLASSLYLAMGTTAGEWRLSAVDPDEPIAPTNITAKRELVYGSANAMPVQVGKDLLFIQRARRKIRQLAYNWESSGYVAPDMTVLAEHITQGGVSEIAYQGNPSPALWGLRSDGVLLGLTYLPEHDVYAWHRHITDGTFESLATIPVDLRSYLYVIVNRTINGSTQRNIEYLTPEFTGDDLSDAFFLDSGLSYSGTSATVFEGLYHLINTAVVALADGEVVTGITVDAVGGVTIPTAAEVVHVGLPYTMTLQTMRLEVPKAGAATSQGLIKRISEVIVRVWNTSDFKIGPSADDTVTVDTGSGLFTGDSRVVWPSGYDRDAYITIVQSDPKPLTVRSMTVKVSTGDM